MFVCYAPHAGQWRAWDARGLLGVAQTEETSRRLVTQAAGLGERARRMIGRGVLLREAVRLASDGHRQLVASVLHLEAAGAVLFPKAEEELAELLDEFTRLY